MDRFSTLWKCTDDFENHEELTLRDHLAIARTKLANERTLFSYIRTSLYLLTAGIGILELKSVEHLKIIAYLSIIFSGSLFLTGWLRFYKLRKHLRNYLPKTSSDEDTTKNNPVERLKNTESVRSPLQS